VAGGIADLLTGAWRHVVANARVYAVVWGATLLAVALMWSHDTAWLGAIQAAGQGTDTVAQELSRIGRFENSSLVLSVILGAIGLATRKARWRDAAVACLLAGIVGGLAVNVLRPTFGRARPHSEMEQGLHWFEMRADLHSLPSGHATSNMASAAAVAVVLPAVGVPAVVVATAIGWSRLQLNQHYPTDVLLGLVLGATVGVAVGASTVERRRRARSSATGRS